LIIDDEPLVSRALARLLAERYRVACAFAPAALEMLRSGARFDAVVCDMQMPGLNGAQLYRAILAFAPEQAARMIFMTAGAGGWVEGFLGSVSNPRLYKPFEADDLERLLASLPHAAPAAGPERGATPAGAPDPGCPGDVDPARCR
jgi:CheY-like chemotaxis protein